MVVFLVILAILGWVAGSFLLSQATMGVGVLAAACLFGIFARIAQAGDQHREIMRTLRSGGEPSRADPPRPSMPGDWFCNQCGNRNTTNVFDCTNCGAGRPKP